MDEAEGGGGGGYVDGGVPADHFQQNEAISAVADERFLVEEDDDYEDLYNDVNVGEGLLQSMRKNEDLGFRNEDEIMAGQPPQAQTQVVIPPSVSAVRLVTSVVGDGERKCERDLDVGNVGGETCSRVSDGRMDVYHNQGCRGDDMCGNVPLLPGGAGGAGVGGGNGGGGVLRVELGHPSTKVVDVQGQTINHNAMAVQGVGHMQQPNGLNGLDNADAMGRHTSLVGKMNDTGGNVVVGGHLVGGGPGGGGGGSTILFVGDLHWWTTDVELKAVLVRYGMVKEVKFFDEKASGKSKGYCQVEFYDSAAATACKEGMNGHIFNGRPCVVAFASPFTVKRMGDAQVNRNQHNAQQPPSQVRRGPNDAGNKPIGNNITTGGNYQGGENNRGYGRCNWGRGNVQGMGNRGHVGPIRSRPGGMGRRGMMGIGGNGFGQAMGASPLMMHPQAMIGQGFDPTFAGPMGRMGSYGGFPGGPAPPFPGLMPSFPPVGAVGLPGVAPHVNPAFFGRVMPMNGMAMMPNSGFVGPNMGMWPDPSMVEWTGNEPGRAAESSYGEEATSDRQYGEASHDRGGWPNSAKEKERGSERDWSATSDMRRHCDDREVGRDHGRERDRDHELSRDRDPEHDRDRERYRDVRDRYADHQKQRDYEQEYDDEWERGRFSRTQSNSRVSHVEEQL
ncbi:hypothetical protein Dimus_014454 [Dionaea muscipula]